MADYKNIKDMKSKETKKNVYVLVSDDAIFSSTAKYDMDKHLVSNDCSLSLEDVMENTYKLVFGLVLDPKELPYEISVGILNKNSLWVIFDRHTYIDIEECRFLSEATGLIEDYIYENPEADLSNVAIILGQDIPFAFTSSKAGVSVMPSEVYK